MIFILIAYYIVEIYIFLEIRIVDVIAVWWNENVS